MRVLHVGCGNQEFPEWFDGAEEVRLDVNPDVRTHIVASMVDMGEIGEYDTVYSSHALEHLYPYDVPRALAEFYRVLRPGGQLMLFVPDLEGIHATDDVVYIAPCGPITGLDMIYGYSRELQRMPYMAHHTGFTSKTLAKHLEAAGFVDVVTRRLMYQNLLAIARKPCTPSA